MKQVDWTVLASTLAAAVVSCVAMVLVGKNLLPLSAALAILGATHMSVGAMKSFLPATPASAPPASPSPATDAPKATDNVEGDGI